MALTLEDTNTTRYNKSWLKEHFYEKKTMINPWTWAMHINRNAPVKDPTLIEGCIAKKVSLAKIDKDQFLCIECDSFQVCQTVKDYLKAYSELIGDKKE
jgi:hypothetical protein